ncbi:MAG: hypothetical protein DRQ40_00480 [Gammaproteobacteria bacterium]|nr:MAG: hypothetical protein DRQ40_00480 [Gammaproteobacteria bacterium]
MAANKGITVEMIEKLARQGLTCSEIADSLGVSKTGISKRLKKYNIPHTTAADKHHQIALQICELFKSTEISLQDIALEFNISKARVSQILKKYEVEVPTERKNSIRRKTVQEKYGADNVMFVDEIIEKRSKYFLNKFGVDNPLKSKEIQEKARTTLEERYGVNNPLKSDAVRLNIKETNLRRYRGNAPICCSEVSEKMKATCKNRYGVENFRQAHLDSSTVDLINDKDRFIEQLIQWHHVEQLTLGEIGSKLGYQNGVSRFMRELGIEVKNFSRSAFEREIADFVVSLTDQEVLFNDRQFTFELDIHIPELKLAIEADGLYYHSLNNMEDVQNKKFYHRDKTEKCKDRGIRLLHILECDWYNPTKQTIWKSMLTNLIASERMKKIYARKCQVMEITPSEARDFYNRNHLQGAVGAFVHLGLVYENELVSCMSFSKGKENQQWQLTRFASEKGFNILGAASRLFKNFLKIYKVLEVNTFADLMYSYGDLYYKLEFELSGKVPPRYQYTDCKQLFHRRSFQKQHLEKMLGSLYLPELTEFQNIFKNTRYRVIFDAGKLKFTYRVPKSSSL